MNISCNFVFNYLIISLWLCLQAFKEMLYAAQDQAPSIEGIPHTHLFKLCTIIRQLMTYENQIITRNVELLLRLETGSYNGQANSQEPCECETHSDMRSLT